MIDEIECHRYFYKFLKGTITLSELEQWLYNHEELEEILGKSVYFELISRDYKNKYALEDTKKQIKGLINIGFFEQERIINSLEKLIDTSEGDRKSTRLNSSHVKISYAVFCLNK